MPTNVSIEDILDDLLEKLGQLPGIIGHLGDIVGRMTSGLTPLFSALSNLARFNSGAGNTGSGVGGTSSSPGNSTGVGAGLEKLAVGGAVAAAALGALAVSANIVEQQFKKLEGFVRLFNPGITDRFQQSLDNLGATIGSAFVPVFQAATEVVRRWTSILAPVMASLTPIIRQFSDILGNILVKALTQLGSVLNALVPIVSILLEGFSLISEILLNVFNSIGQFIRVLVLVTRVLFELSGLGLAIRTLTKLLEALNAAITIFDEALSILEVVVTSLIDTVMTFAGSLFPIKDIMNKLTDSIQYVIRNMYVFAVMLAKMAGLSNIVDALISHVEGKLKPGETAAQTPQIKSLEQLSKDLALAAAAAGGASGPGGVKNQQEFWAKTLEEMRAAKANGVSIKDLLGEIIKEIK